MKQRLMLLAPLFLMVTLYSNPMETVAATGESVDTSQPIDTNTTPNQETAVITAETVAPVSTTPLITAPSTNSLETATTDTTPPTTDVTAPATSATEPAAPTATANDTITPTNTTADPTVPATTVVDPTVPAATVVDPTVPAAAVVDPTVPAAAVVDPTVPAAAVVDPTVPAAAVVDPTVPAAAVVDPTVPTATTVDPTVPAATVADPTDPTTPTADLTAPAGTVIEPVPPTETVTEVNPAVEPVVEEEIVEASAVEGANLALMALAEEYSTSPSTLINHVDTNENVIALTFDDGHSYENLSAILSILDEFGIKATFFMNGDASAELLQQIVDAGHELGNHGYSHLDSTTISSDALANDVNLMEDYIQASTGTTSRPLFRAPYGAYNDSVLETVGNLGYEYTIGWSIDTLDWTGISATEISNAITNYVTPGSIVLMHASVGAANTPDSLWYSLSALKNAGYSFATISELLGLDVAEAPVVEAPVVEEPAAVEEFGTGPSRWVDDVDTNQQYISLTFDDLEETDVVTEILEILADQNVKATFFPDSNTDPALLAMIVAQGHDIGNHTYSHPYSSQITADELASELDTMENVIVGATGVTSRPFFRPPYGDYDASVLETAGSLGYEYTIGWTTDTYDWDGYTATAIADQVVNNLYPGSIYLLHDDNDTPEALWYIIAAVRAAGFDFMTITDLLALDGVFTEPGTIEVPIDPVNPTDTVNPADPTAPITDPVTGVTNPIITKEMVTDRTGVTGVAEPFIVYADGVYNMFFDVIAGYNPNTQTTADEIGHAWSNDMINWTYTQIVLGQETNGTRAASPYVFEYQNEYYMVPDLVGNVNVYKASSFPLKWELYGTLMTGTFVDPLVFEMDNVWYMTTSETPFNSLNLYNNTSGDWRNSNWNFQSTIVPESTTEEGLRNGGTPFIYADHVILPVEVTPKDTRIYGEYTDWYQLSNLTPTTVSVSKLGTAVTSALNDEWNGDAMHHIANVSYGTGVMYAVDGYNWNRSEYSIGLMTGTAPTSGTIPPVVTPVDPPVPVTSITNPMITKEMVTDRTGVTGVAEPFIVFENGVYNMFFDVIAGYNPNTKTTADEIGHAWSTDMLNWTYTQIVLGQETNGTRAASPYVFKYQNEYYMIPDLVGNVNVYKASSFPLKWELYGTLMTGTFVDPLVFEMDNVWYMTTSETPFNSLNLYNNTSGDWRNSNWNFQSTIVPESTTEEGLRNGGTPFIYADHVILPVEVTPKDTRIYGEYTDWYQLSNLTPTTVSVSKLGTAVTSALNDEWNGDAMHHISSVPYGTGVMYAVDGYNWNRAEYSIGLMTGTAPTSGTIPPVVTPVDPNVPALDIDLSAVTNFFSVKNPVLSIASITDRVASNGIANPYIIMVDGTYHVFFNIVQGYNPDTGVTADEIAHAWSTDLIQWNYTQVVLGEDITGTNTASPYVFEYQNEYYMIPDLTGNVNVYKASSFPLQWEFYSTLLTGNFVDPLVFELNNTWYMTTSEQPYNSLSLYQNTSGDWRNSSWTLHPEGQIITETASESGLRTAGNPFIYDDYVILPVQVTPADGVYGQYTNWYQISNITATSVTVTNRGTATSGQNNLMWNSDAMHHISHAAYDGGNIYAVDGLFNGVYTIGLYTDIAQTIVGPAVVPFPSVGNPILMSDILSDRVGGAEGVADPFIVYEDGTYYLFFESIGGYDSTTGQTADEVAYAWSTDLIDWNYSQIVLGPETNGVRAAYPNIFKYDGSYYMVPDITGNVEAYVATDFPSQWEYSSTLLEGSYVDTNIFSVNDVWYMTTSETPYMSLSLYHNTSGDWRNNQWEWQEDILPANGDEYSFRGAGNPFVYDDLVILPVQVHPDGGIYGQYVYWYLLSSLSTDSVEVTLLGTAVDAQNNGMWNDEGMHQISHADYLDGYIYAVDGFNNGEYSIGLYVDAKLA
ncbi:polysaccharide deacetylase [Trichococcus palustris]|uniref:Polysaccharide deacetylase n=2 Tax=Trichococcus palustris TaxID=140314 RepID=A0A143YVV2_9LACT|nr:polysaccharide deacetylase family protein [Trichococcus palustris]CZQ97095.1 polysaccharide deacetylase [Trichococcus palustris]